MMNTMRRLAPLSPLSVRTTSLLLTGALVLSACGKKPEAAPSTTAVQMIGPDNIAVASTDTLRSGPAISGALVADREARIRAEVAGAVLQTFVEAGQRVETGTPLVRIDDAVLQDAVKPLPAPGGLSSKARSRNPSATM